MVNKYDSIIHKNVPLANRGAGFREAFSQLGGLRALLDLPFMALTASAPPLVQSEISSSLFLVDPVMVLGDLDRKNIYISASPIKSLNVGVYFSYRFLV